VWEEKSLAKAKHKGYKDLLNGKLEIPMDGKVLDPIQDADKGQD
jgi:hypothetical protein